MLIEMPYGVVSIDNREQAAQFIKNHCKNCPYSIGSQPCSGAQASICDATIDQLLQQYGIKKPD